MLYRQEQGGIRLMTYLDIVLIALIQGVGSVLPLSAKGHFALFTGLTADPQAFAVVSVAVHLGVALGLMAWLWRDCLSLLVGMGKLVKGKSDPGGRLLLLLMVASLPSGLLAGWLLNTVALPQGQLLAASCLLGFGLLMAVADRLGVTVSRVEHLGYGTVAVLGLLQLLALLPGVSRMGVTVTATRLLGLERREAARLSMLMAVPMLLGYGLFQLWHLTRAISLVMSADLALAAGLAALVAWAMAGLLLAWLRRHTFLPFALWRIMLGVGVIALHFLSA